MPAEESLSCPLFGLTIVEIFIIYCGFDTRGTSIEIWENLMENDRMDKLVKIARKACVTESGRYELESLEQYLRCVADLDKYSEDDRKRFAAEFHALSDEDRQYVVNRVYNRTHPGRFHLTESETQELTESRKDLRFHERAQLSAVWNAWNGIAWLDIGKVFDAYIEIDDQSSSEREKRPYAHVYYKEGYTRRVETVDILASVERDASAIGNPIIAAAVKYWQHVLYSKNIHNVRNREDDNFAIEYVREKYTRHHIAVAEGNINAISKMLIAGALKTGVSPKIGLGYSAELLGINEGTLLHEVWKAFRNWRIPDLENSDEIEGLKQKLHSMANNQALTNRGIDPDTILRFITEAESGGGYEYFDPDKKRPSWAAFKNSFLAWYFSADVRTIKNYQSLARKKPVDGSKVTKSFFLPPAYQLTSLLVNLFETPLVFVREPVRIRETGGHVHIEEAILKKESVI